MAPNAIVTVNSLCGIPLVKPGRENELAALADLSEFWRRRGHALPQLIVHKMQLDVFELLERVFLSGGYWAVTAAQVRASASEHCLDISEP